MPTLGIPVVHRSPARGSASGMGSSEARAGTHHGGSRPGLIALYAPKMPYLGHQCKRKSLTFAFAPTPSPRPHVPSEGSGGSSPFMSLDEGCAGWAGAGP